MTINSERREIAAKLRTLEPWAHFGTGEPITREEVEDVLGFEYSIGDSYDAAGVRRLADLIDRPTSKREDAGDYWRCTHCGALTRVDAVADSVGFVAVRCCGNCGREFE